MNQQIIQGVRFHFDQIEEGNYLRHIKAFHHLTQLSFSKPITFFVGENGSGKSTLLQAMAIASNFNPEGGTKNYHFSTYQSNTNIDQAITLIKGSRKEQWGYYLKAESFYNVATMEEEYALGKSKHYHEMSHGESFLSLIQKEFCDNGLYFLDEIEAALSLQRQLTLLAEIEHYAKKGAQFFIVTHSPILLALPNADIYQFDDKGIHLCQYEETESYQITKMFMENRSSILNYLLEKDE